MIKVLWAILFVAASGAPVIEEQNLIAAMKRFKEENVGEFGNNFEGDMILTEEQYEKLTVDGNDRNGLINVTKRWPDRVLVYHIVADDFDDKQVEMIRVAMEDISNKSCIRFRPRFGKEHAVIIQGSENGCYSSVGYTTAEEDGDSSQTLNLADGCFHHGTIVHEILHALGFYHMQSTHNRDEFVKVNWENIRPGYEHNFAKYTSETVTNFGLPYDYSSVMHYPATAFSSNGKPTIIPLQDGIKIGQREGLSESDSLKLNKMYCELRQK